MNLKGIPIVIDPELEPDEWYLVDSSDERPSFGTTNYVSIAPTKYEHKPMTGKCVKCGEARPGQCECVPAAQYTWNSLRDDYQKQCSLSLIIDMMEKMTEGMLWWGDRKYIDSILPNPLFADSASNAINSIVMRYGFGMHYGHDKISYIFSLSDW